MTLDDLGNIGELVAAIATVATLGYLAFQIRQNTKAIRGSAAETVMQSEIAAAALVIEHANVYRRGNADISELNPDERVMYEELIYIEFSQHWSAFTQYRAGLMSEATFEAFKVAWQQGMLNPGYQSVWGDLKGQYPEDFRSYFDELPLVAGNEAVTRDD
jgi:hypothetical protein